MELIYYAKTKATYRKEQMQLTTGKPSLWDFCNPYNLDGTPLCVFMLKHSDSVKIGVL